ncbi:polysaccharide deacetylase family protein [bacterium]|nr:polysaccharide deacetylase family protein [bacterium]
MKFLIFTIFTTLLNLSHAKEISISFDDAPRRLTGHFTGIERAKQIVEKLKNVQVNDVTFYCNSQAINEQTKDIIQYYNDAKLTIANHTHSHPDFNKLTYDDFSKDFLEADKFLSKYSHYSKRFRFPYLREGNELQKRDQMRQLLEKMGYKNAYITVDFSDWHLEDLYRTSLANKEKVDLNKLKNLYISLTKESLEHYDSLAKKYLNRSPKHVLLLHETDLAALFIDDLVKALRSWGWTIISNNEAYTDEIAQFQLPQVLGYNPGRIGEIAIAKGHDIKDVWAQSTYPAYITKRYQSEVVK